MNTFEQVQNALKSMTKADLGESVLTPEQATKFIEEAQLNSTIIGDATKLDMKSHTRNIDRINYANFELNKLVEGQAITEGNKVTFATNKLIVEEFGAHFGLTDTFLEDNIAKGSLQSTILKLFGAGAGKKMGELCLNGTKDAEGIDGWMTKVGNKLTSGYDVTDVEDMFEKALLTLPAQYDERGKLVFYVTRKMENDYRNVLRARGTVLGDAAQTQNGGLTYKGITVKVANELEEGKALLVNPANLVYGLYRDVKIESERNASKRATDFYLSFRLDAHFEDEKAAVAVEGYTGPTA